MAAAPSSSPGHDTSFLPVKSHRELAGAPSPADFGDAQRERCCDNLWFKNPIKIPTAIDVVALKEPEPPFAEDADGCGNVAKRCLKETVPGRYVYCGPETMEVDPGFTGVIRFHFRQEFGPFAVGFKFEAVDGCTAVFEMNLLRRDVLREDNPAMSYGATIVTGGDLVYHHFRGCGNGKRYDLFKTMAKWCFGEALAPVGFYLCNVHMEIDFAGVNSGKMPDNYYRDPFRMDLKALWYGDAVRSAGPAEAWRDFLKFQTRAAYEEALERLKAGGFTVCCSTTDRAEEGKISKIGDWEGTLEFRPFIPFSSDRRLPGVYKHENLPESPVFKSSTSRESTRFPGARFSRSSISYYDWYHASFTRDLQLCVTRHHPAEAHGLHNRERRLMTAPTAVGLKSLMMRFGGRHTVLVDDAGQAVLRPHGLGTDVVGRCRWNPEGTHCEFMGEYPYKAVSLGRCYRCTYDVAVPWAGHNSTIGRATVLFSKELKGRGDNEPLGRPDATLSHFTHNIAIELPFRNATMVPVGVLPGDEFFDPFAFARTLRPVYMSKPDGEKRWAVLHHEARVALWTFMLCMTRRRQWTSFRDLTGFEFSPDGKAACEAYTILKGGSKNDMGVTLFRDDPFRLPLPCLPNDVLVTKILPCVRLTDLGAPTTTAARPQHSVVKRLEKAVFLAEWVSRDAKQLLALPGGLAETARCRTHHVPAAAAAAAAAAAGHGEDKDREVQVLLVRSRCDVQRETMTYESLKQRAGSLPILVRAAKNKLANPDTGVIVLRRLCTDIEREMDNTSYDKTMKRIEDIVWVKGGDAPAPTPSTGPKKRKRSVKAGAGAVHSTCSECDFQQMVRTGAGGRYKSKCTECGAKMRTCQGDDASLKSARLD